MHSDPAVHAKALQKDRKCKETITNTCGGILVLRLQGSIPSEAAVQLGHVLLQNEEALGCFWVHIIVTTITAA